MGIVQLPWMVALGLYKEEDVIEVNPRTGVRFAEDESEGRCAQAE